MNKKIVIIIASVLALAVVAVVIFVKISFPQPDSDVVEGDMSSNIENVINTDTNTTNSEYDFSVDNTSTSQDTTNIESNNNENTMPNPDGESFRGDWFWNGERIPNSDHDYSDVPRRESGSAGNDFDEEQKLNAVNQQEYKDNAVAFLYGFLTYNSSLLSSGQYLASWQSYVSSDALVKNSGSGMLYQHALPAWNSNMSTYNEVTSNVRDIVAESIYVSRSGADANKIVVRCSCITTRNDALPGEIVNWENVHTYSESWAIAFDANGKIINATRQSASALDHDPDWVSSGGFDY